MIGALGVARFLRSLFTPSAAMRALVRNLVGDHAAIHATVVNGGPGLLVAVGDRVAGVMSLDVTSDGVAAVHLQANPDKLRTRHAPVGGQRARQSARRRLVTQITAASCQGSRRCPVQDASTPDQTGETVTHHIVVLGAGYAGAHAAGRLARRLHPDDARSRW